MKISNNLKLNVNFQKKKDSKAIKKWKLPKIKILKN